MNSIGVVAGAETNLVRWRPLDFFLAAADKLLRTYTTNWFQADPPSYLATYYGFPNRAGNLPNNPGYYFYMDKFGQTNIYDQNGVGLVNVPLYGMTNQMPTFGITNIPVYINSNFVYSPAVNRLLQLAANLYDATTNGPIVNGIPLNLPHVFQPVVEHDAYGNVFIVSYLAVTNVSAGVGPLSLPLAVSDPRITRYLNQAPTQGPILNQNGTAPVNVYGVPWIIGAKKRLPNFNQLYLINAAQVTRKLQISRNTTNSLTAVYTTNQMYDLSISNSLGITFWNSYYTNYPRPLTIYAHDYLYETLTNSTMPAVWYAEFDIPGAYVGSWPGSQWNGGGPQTNSFVTANWSTNYLPDSICYVAPNTPLAFPLNTWTSPGLAQLPQIGLMITNELQAYILDGSNVIDYVQLRDPISNGNLNQALADPDYVQEGNVYLQWSTNLYPVVPAGVLNQIWISGHPSPQTPATQMPAGGQWSNARTVIPGDTTPPAEAAFFNGFFTPTFYYVGADGKGQTYVNSQLSVQAPYTPSRTVFSSFLLQANDPLVHYLGSDLNSQYGASAVWSAKQTWKNGVWFHLDDQSLPQPPISPLGGRYQPWLQKGQMDALANVIPVTNNYAVKDPQVKSSDYWDFPTNQYPTVGWIGRVHRGTPWQTVYLEDADRLKAPNSAGYDAGYGTNTWANWMGDLLRQNEAIFSYAQYYDAANCAPVQDRLLFDIFTTRFNDNAVRGTLPVNQTHLAAWSALFSGMWCSPTTRRSSPPTPL